MRASSATSPRRVATAAADHSQAKLVGSIKDTALTPQTIDNTASKSPLPSADRHSHYRLLRVIHPGQTCPRMSESSSNDQSDPESPAAETTLPTHPTHRPQAAEPTRRAGEARPRPHNADPQSSGPESPPPRATVFPGRPLASNPCWSGPGQGWPGGPSPKATRSALEAGCGSTTLQRSGRPNGANERGVRTSRVGRSRSNTLQSTQPALPITHPRQIRGLSAHFNVPPPPMSHLCSTVTFTVRSEGLTSSGWP